MYLNLKCFYRFTLTGKSFNVNLSVNVGNPPTTFSQFSKSYGQSLIVKWLGFKQFEFPLPLQPATLQPNFSPNI